MMKKIFSIVAVVLISAVAFAGCNTTSQTSSDGEGSSTSSVSSDEASETEIVNAEDYSRDFEGFVQYMTDGGYISGDGTALSASAIGAVQGERFTVGSGTSKFYVELYEFDVENMNDTASATVSDAKADGTFNLYGDLTATQNTLAVATEDGRFLMLYTDSSTSEGNLDAKQKAADAVLSF